MPKKIIFVSRLDVDCALGARVLCAIAPRLIDIYPDLTIILIGGGTALPEITQSAIEANQKINQKLNKSSDTVAYSLDFNQELSKSTDKISQRFNYSLGIGGSFRNNRKVNTNIIQKAKSERKSSKRMGTDSLTKAQNRAQIGRSEVNKNCSPRAAGIEYECIKVMGKLADPAKFYKNADADTLFVGVSRSALEAMAHGLPVILLGDEGYLGLFDESKLAAAKRTNFTARGIKAVLVRQQPDCYY